MRPAFFNNFADDLASIVARDPAARSRIEVLIAYPGVHALLIHRVAHAAYKRGLPLIARLLSQTARFLTGIEIHPGATIGRRLFIDHGMGVVIGETAEIGDDVTLYQGVTLGGTTLDVGKRHPTLGDGVIVGAGAQILGPIKVGDNARVGANAVAVAEVAPGTTVVGIPARAVQPRGVAAKPVPVEAVAAKPAAFCAYGIGDDLPDPVARALTGLMDEVTLLRGRVAELEATQSRKAEDIDPPGSLAPSSSPDLEMRS